MNDSSPLQELKSLKNLKLTHIRLIAVRVRQADTGGVILLADLLPCFHGSRSFPCHLRLVLRDCPPGYLLRHLAWLLLLRDVGLGKGTMLEDRPAVSLLMGGAGGERPVCHRGHSSGAPGRGQPGTRDAISTPIRLQKL